MRRSERNLTNHHNPNTWQHLRPMVWELACTEVPTIYGFRYRAGSSIWIDWGDGGRSSPSNPSQEVANNGQAEHVYTIPGTYKIRVLGDVRWICLHAFEYDYLDTRVTRVLTFGNLPLESLEDTFRRLGGLQYVPPELPSTVRDLNGTFFECYRLNDANLETWNTERIESMDDTFMFAMSFDRSLQGWNTGRVRSMNRTFCHADAFDGDVSTWNTERVESMVGTFQCAFRFNQSLDRWKTGRVKDMRSMFENARAFNRPLGTWDVRRVLYMDRMFCDAESFDQPLHTWNLQSVQGMTSLFEHASSFACDLSSWVLPNVRYEPPRFHRYSPLERNAHLHPRWANPVH